MQKQFKVANISAAREKQYGVTVDDGPPIVINQCSWRHPDQTLRLPRHGLPTEPEPDTCRHAHRSPRRARRMLEQPLRAAAGCISQNPVTEEAVACTRQPSSVHSSTRRRSCCRNRISLRVSQHGSKANGKQAREELVDLERYGVVTCLPMMGARRVPEMADISSQS